MPEEEETVSVYKVFNSSRLLSDFTSWMRSQSSQVFFFKPPLKNKLRISHQNFSPFLSFLPAVSSGSGSEGQLLGMGMWSLGLGAVGAALAGIFLANTDLCLPKAGSASLDYLAETDLRSSTDGGRRPCFG